MELPRFPDGEVGYAIGDVHGRADLLRLMLDQIEADAAARPQTPIVIFLGDYVDRGPDSRAVIDLVLDLRTRLPVVALRGNHEHAMLEFLNNPVRGRQWLKFGGRATLQSYGVAIPADDDFTAYVGTAQALRVAMTDVHVTFLEDLKPWAACGDFLFVHAGVDPSRPLEEQRLADLLYIREPFLSMRKRFSHVVVHGHTPGERPYRNRRRIALDTGAYRTGRLTAARFVGAEVTTLTVSLPIPPGPATGAEEDWLAGPAPTAQEDVRPGLHGHMPSP